MNYVLYINKLYKLLNFIHKVELLFLKYFFKNRLKKSKCVKKLPKSRKKNRARFLFRAAPATNSQKCSHAHEPWEKYKKTKTIYFSTQNSVLIIIKTDITR